MTDLTESIIPIVPQAVCPATHAETARSFRLGTTITALQRMNGLGSGRHSDKEKFCVISIA